MATPDPKDHLIVPIFKTHSTVNKAKSQKAGRPIFDDVEVVEIRMAANKQTVGVFPANEVWRWVDTPDGGREPMTYAMRFNDQYKRFKDNAAQAQSGTPIEELPFLTQGKRLELKALNVFTAETLASLDGQPLRQLGVGGREMKDQAQAYLDLAAKTADTTRLASENEQLRQQIAAMKKDQQTAALKAGAGDAEKREASPFDDMEKDDIKQWIEDATGDRPRGNPNKETLVRMADEVNANLKKKADEGK